MAQLVGQLEIQLLTELSRIQTDMDKAKRAVGNAMSAIDLSVARAAKSMEDYAKTSGNATDQSIAKAKADAETTKKTEAEKTLAKNQHAMKLIDLNNKIQQSNKAAADSHAQASAKVAKDLRDEAAALAAFKTEVQNAELNLVHFGRAKTAAFLQDKGARLGFDPAMVQAEIAGLKKIEAANKAAFAAANPHIAELSKRAEAAGTSVKVLSASLRNVPAQFTDIIVSLQGGQAPLTVLLQQGGQLKDMFGGVGNAARALGGYVVGLINPFSLAAAAVATLGYSYYAGSKEQDAYIKALTLTGNAVGLTSGQLADMARSMAAVGGTQSKAAEALVEFVNAGAAGAGSLQKFTATAIAFEKATGTAVSETAKQFAELGKAPLEASINLNEATGFLTMSLYEQVKALDEQGKKTEAAKVAQQAYDDTLNQNTARITANLGTIEKSWNAIASATKGAWDWMMNVGRTTGPQQQLAKLAAEIASKEAMINAPHALEREKNEARKDLKPLRDKYDELSKTSALAAIRATEAGIAAKQLKDQIEFDKGHEKYMTNAVKLERELAAAKERYARVSFDEASRLKNLPAYEDEVKKLKDQYKEKTGPKAKAEKVEGFGNELTATKTWLSTQERMIQDSYSTQQKSIEDAYKAQEMSAAEYYARQLSSDEASLREREIARAEAETRFNDEMARRKQITEARPASKDRTTTLNDLANEAENFAAAQEAARQKDINNMAKHSNAMAREIDKESQKVTGSVDTYIADMQRKAQADATLLAAREAMAGQAPEIIAGVEAELKVRADSAKLLDQTAESYALAAKNAREYEDELQSQYGSGKEVTAGQIRLLEELNAAAGDARRSLLKLGGAVDTSALDSGSRAFAASIKAQTDAVTKEIQKSLVDGIMSAGKDGGAGLRKALEEALITRPLRMAIDAYFLPISNSIYQGAAGQTIGASAAGATGLQSTLNAASLAVSNFGSTLIGTAANVATGGATLAQTWAAGSAMMSTTGGTMAGIAMKIGAAAPHIAAAAVAANVLSNAIDRANGSVTAAGTFAYGHNSATGFKTGGRADFIQDGGGGTHLNQEWFDPGEETSRYMSAMGNLVTKSVKEWAAAIGLSAEAVDGYAATVQAAIGGGMSKAEERQSIYKAMAGYGDAMVQALFGKVMAFANGDEAPSAVLERMGNDVTAVNNILRDNGHALYDSTFESAKAVQVLIDSVGGLDKFTALASTLETVNNVLSKLGKGTFELSMDGAKAANDLAKSVGGTAKLSELADELIHVNENLAKLGEPLLDVSVASAQAAHTMLTATDSAVKAMEAAEKLEASYASFTASLSGTDNNSVASLQAAFNKAMAAVTATIPSISGASGLTSVTYDQYSSYTDPQRTKLDTAANAYKNLQDAINSAAKTAQDAAKTAQDAADTAAQAYKDALKSVEDSTRDVNRQLRDFGKTDFQKKLSAIADAGQDKQSELDKLSAKAAELSAVATDASLKATASTLDTVSTISNDLIKASTDLSSDSQEVADNIKTTLANSTAALGDALTLAPAISSLFDSILAGLLKIPPALILVSNAVTGVGSAASNASGGLTAFGAAAGMAGSSATSATGPINSAGVAFSAVAPTASAAGAALAALGAAFAMASAALNSLTGTFGAAAGALDGLNAAFASAANGLGSLGSAFESTGASGASLAGSLGGVSEAMAGIAGAAAGAAGNLSAAVGALSAVAGASSSIQAPSGAATAVKAAAVKAAGGGYIRGPGTTTSDEIPAFLSDKEFVMPADSVEQYGLGFMNAVKNGTLKHPVYRHDGGPVGHTHSAVGTLTEAQKQVVYLGEFSAVVTMLGGVVNELKGVGTSLNTIAVQAPETYTDALTALKDAGLDATGMDAAGVSKLILDVLKANPPTQNADGTYTFSEAAQKALEPLANVMGSIPTLLKGLEAMKPWQDKLAVLMGTTTERELALQKDLASTTDATTQALIRQVYAQEDLNKAREEEAKALDSVKESLKNFQKESSSLAADLASAFGTPGGDSSAKTIRKDLALEDVRETAKDAGADGASVLAAAGKQYDLNEARKEEIKLLTDSKSRLKSYTDAGASKQVEIMRLQGNDTGADAAQEAIDLADVYKSTADAMELLKTEGLTGLDIAALELTISANEATKAQYKKNAEDDKAIEILNRYKSAQEDADATNIELMKAMGNTAGAAALELANATKGFSDAQVATVRQTNATKGLIAAYGSLSSTADMVTNSRIGLLTAKGDTTGAAALQREFDIKPYVTAIADATRDLGTATTEAEKEILNNIISTNKGAIGNYDLSKSLDKEAQAANDAKTAADALASSYADLKKQIENANIELLRASGKTAEADEAAMALALRDHAGDAYYESLYRELLTIQKLTAARQQLNGMEDTAIQSQIKLIRAKGYSGEANFMEREAFLAKASLPSAQAKAELDASNVSWGEFLKSKGVTDAAQLGSPAALADPVAVSYGAGQTTNLANALAAGIVKVNSSQDYWSLLQAGTGTNFINEEQLKALYEFGLNQRTDSQQASLQSVVDTAQGIAAAYDLNKSLEGQLKIIELQDEAYKQNLDAQKSLADAQKAYADVLKSTINTMQDFLKTLDGAASPLQNLSSARVNFRAVADKVATGDTSAYKDLTPAAKTFLDLSKSYSKSIQDYRRDEAQVRTILNAVIRVNQNELDKIPKEIASAADPTKDAWLKLQEATKKETETSFMLTALSVDKAESTKRLQTAEETLAKRYIEAVVQLEEVKRTPLLDAFKDAVKNKVADAALPDYSATFALGDIWGTKIAGVLPSTPMTNAELNALIAKTFPGLVASDFLVPLTPSQLSSLVSGTFPKLTAANLISVPANMVELVNAELAKVFTPNFAGPAFNAQQMMQDAINRVLAAVAKPNIAPDTVTTAVNKVLEQELTGGTTGTGTSITPTVVTPPIVSPIDVGTPPVKPLDTESSAYAKILAAGYTPGSLNTAVNAFYGDRYTDRVGISTFKELADVARFARLPGFAVGTNYVPQDMIAQIHEGEAIIPAPFNPAKYGRDSGNTALVEKIQELTAKVEVLTQKLEAGQNAIAANTGKMARTMTKFDIDGLPAERT